MKENIKKHISYYPSGRLRLESSLKNGIPHGLFRTWYENGNLASEQNFKEGIPDGISRYWDENGKLLVESKIVNGTGIEKSWEPVNRLLGEQNWIDGMCTGRNRVRWEDGAIVKDEYWIRNRKVSKNKYIEMCELDDTLPKYDDIIKGKKIKKKSKKKEAFTGYSYLQDETYYHNLFSEHKMVDALFWLTEFNAAERTIGECRRPEDSIELVKDFYILGAIKVWTFDIYGGANEEQNSGKLVIELPNDPLKRKKILEKCNELAIENGFDPNPDNNQKYCLIIIK